MLRLHEWLEDALDLLRRNTDAGVCQRDVHLPFCGGIRQRQRSARGSELQCIRQQVQENLLRAFLIRERCKPIGDVRCHDAQLLLRHLGRDHLQHGIDRLAHRHPLGAIFDPADASLREVQHVRHEAVEIVLAALDLRQVDALLLRDRATHTELDELRVAADGVERRTQLVAHRREEITLGAIGFRRLVREPQQLGLGPTAILDVRVGAEPSKDVAVLVALRGGARKVPAIFTRARLAEPEFNFIGLAGGDGASPPRARRRDVIGMEHLEPRIAKDVVLAHAEVDGRTFAHIVELPIRRRGPHLDRNRVGEKPIAGLAFLGRRARLLTCVQEPLHLVPSKHGFRDIGTMGDDATDGAIGVLKRLVDEIHPTLLGLRACCALQKNRHFAPDEWLPAAVHGVEQVDEALRDHFRKRIDHTGTNERPVPDELQICRVDEFEDVFRTLQNREKSGRLGEDVAQAVLRALRHGARVTQRNFRLHASRCLRRHVQVRDNLSRLGTDRAERVGEPRIGGSVVRALHDEVAILGECRLLPGRTVEEWLDLWPDLEPDLSAGPAQCRRMLGA